MKNVKEKFIDDLIEELNDVNERELILCEKTPIDIPFVVSVIDQQIENCKEFMFDISKNTYSVNGFERNEDDYYTDGRIRVLIEKPDEEKESEYLVDAYYDYCYYIEFSNDDRSWGYCQCDPEDEGYNEKYKCCGDGCDWFAPSFRIEKSISLGGYAWNGNESKYWEYRDEFNSKEKNKNKVVEEYKKKQKKANIKSEISRLEQELQNLE